MKDIETINEFFKNYEIPARKTPVLTWRKSRPTKKEVEMGFRPEEGVDMYCNLSTGTQGYTINDVIDNPEKAVCIERTSRDECRYFCEYIPELDGFALGEVRINARSIKVSSMNQFLKFKKNLEDEKISDSAKQYFKDCIDNLGIIRNWELTGIIFIDKSKKAAFCNCGWGFDYKKGTWLYITKGPMAWHDKITGRVPFKVDNITGERPGINGETYKELVSPLLKVFPRICNVGGNRTVDITESGFCLGTFLKYKEPKGRESKRQIKINSLLDLPLPEIEYKETYEEQMAFINQVKPGLCVLRTMVKNDSDKTMVDGARIYVSKKEVIACRPTNTGKWIEMRLNSQAIHWEFTLEEFDPELVKETKLAYFGSVINDVPSQYKGKYLWALLTYPIVEQLSKAGFKDLVLNKIKMINTGNIMDSINHLFGGVTEKRSLTESVGLNKYQLRKISEIVNTDWFMEDEHPSNWWYYHSFTPVIYLKKILGEDLRAIDNSTFDDTLNFLVDAHNKVREYPAIWNSWKYSSCIDSCVQILRLLKDVYSVSTMKKITPKLFRIIEVEGEIEDKNEQYRKEHGNYYSHCCESRYDFRYYRDYLQMVKDLGDTTHFRPDFDEFNLDTIKDMHDIATEIFQLKKQDIDDKKFTDMSSKWKDWTYDNDTYAVIAPKVSNELAEEGLALHHCVKSYIGRVVNGTTNILFIREKTDLSKPFFTVEVTNDATIQQVHGFGNRNSNTEPGLDEFIKEWIKACHMKTSNFDKIR